LLPLGVGDLSGARVEIAAPTASVRVSRRIDRRHNEQEHTMDINITLAIKADPQAVWSALTDGALTPAYYLGFKAEYDLSAGAPYRYTVGGGSMITGTVLDVDAPRRLVATFNGAWDASVAELPESQVAFELIEPVMPMPGVTFLSCTHRGLPDSPIAGDLEQGWVAILSGLKTLLETGTPMVGAAAA
jgi:uncharacterized protein YndB with AHSA1/START domain